MTNPVSLDLKTLFPNSTYDKSPLWIQSSNAKKSGFSNTWLPKEVKGRGWYEEKAILRELWLTWASIWKSDHFIPFSSFNYYCLLRYNWNITFCKFQVKMCWFDTFIHCYMITTIALANTSTELYYLSFSVLSWITITDLSPCLFVTSWS